MVELPRGTVTFLLTDVEGSTALWEAAPDAMHAALARHDLLFEEAVRERRGVHIRPRGKATADLPCSPARLTRSPRRRSSNGRSHRSPGSYHVRSWSESAFTPVTPRSAMATTTARP